MEEGEGGPGTCTQRDGRCAGHSAYANVAIGRQIKFPSAAMAAEVGSAEEDEDQAPNERERHPRPTGKRGKKRYDLPPGARVRAPKKRTRVSRLENGACPLSFDAKVRDLTTAQRMTTGYTATLCPVVLADNISRH